MDKKHPFGLKKDARARKEKRGGAAALPGAAGAGAEASGVFDSGAAALSTIGRASPTAGAPAGLWEGVVGLVSKATGLGAVAAGKAAVVALVVGASSLAAGVSLYIGNSTTSAAPSLGPRVFVDPANDELPSPAPAAPAAPREEVPPAGGSLEYLSQGNAPAPEPEAAPETPADAPAALPEVKTAEAPNHDAPPPAAAKPLAEVPKPKMAKRAMPERRGETGGKVTLEPLASLGGKMGAGFQEVYRPSRAGAFDGMSQAQPRYGANRKAAVVRSGSNAMQQAKFANRLSKSGQRMSASAAAAHTASQPFDGGNRAAALGATRPGGAALGGTGVASSANSLLDSKSVEPPPAPDADKKGENKTPYQGLIMAAIAALLIGTVLLMIAGKMSGDAKKCTGPDCAAKLKAAKMLAMAAMAAGGAAAAMGGILAGQYDQMTQGMPFIMGGGILALQAGMVLAKDEKAGSDGQEGVGNAAGQAAQAAQGLLGQNNVNSGNGSSDSSPQQPQRTDVNRQNAPIYRGNINTP